MDLDHLNAAAGPMPVDAAVVATKQEIRQLWAENQTIQARDEENRFNLGKKLDELHALRAHHGNGTYDDDVKELGIPKVTAWRVRNFYRDLAGLAPLPQPQFVSNETNSTAATAAAPVNTVENDVRSALINEGFNREDVDKLVFDASWSLDEAHRYAHQQLRPSMSDVTPSGPGSPASAPAPTGSPKSAAAILRARASKQKKITQVRLDPSRHKTFHQALAKWATALGTVNDSETIFHIVTTIEVPACAK